LTAQAATDLARGFKALGAMSALLDTSTVAAR
jgi:hypothetical protein